MDRGPPLVSTLADGIRDARAEVIFEQPERDRLQRAGHRGDLGEHVYAVDVLLDHPLQPPDLALDPAQTVEVGVLVLRITAHAVTIRARGPGCLIGWRRSPSRVLSPIRPGVAGPGGGPTDPGGGIVPGLVTSQASAPGSVPSSGSASGGQWAHQAGTVTRPYGSQPVTGQ